MGYHRFSRGVIWFFMAAVFSIHHVVYLKLFKASSLNRLFSYTFLICFLYSIRIIGFIKSLCSVVSLSIEFPCILDSDSSKSHLCSINYFDDLLLTRHLPYRFPNPSIRWIKLCMIFLWIVVIVPEKLCRWILLH